MFFDELDQFLDGFRTRNLARSEEISHEEEEDIIDELLDLYLLAWYEGSQDAARELLIEVEPSIEDAREAIDRPIEGKTFRDRVREYLNGEMGQTTGTPAEAIARVAETDSVRLYNEAGLKTAVKGGATKKTWHTMLDNRVRDGHRFLEGQTVPIDAYFYTEDDKALAPGQFSRADLNCGCRCQLTFSK